MTAGAIVLAAGRGARLGGGLPKQFRRLGDRPLLRWSCEVLKRHPGIAEVVVVVPEEMAADPPAWLLEVCDRVVAGGNTRRASAGRGLAALSESADPVLIHDAARPFVSADLVSRVLDSCRDEPAIPVVTVTDTVKRVDGQGRVTETLERAMLRRVQTPQGFPSAIIRSVHGDPEEGTEAPDDAFLCERAGVAVRTVEGDARNLKITTQADFELAEWLIATGRLPGSADSMRGDDAV